MARLLDDLEFRDARADDAPCIAALVIAGFETYRPFAPPGWNPPSLRYELETVAGLLAKQATYCRVAYDDTGLAGHVGVIAMADCRLPVDAPGTAHFWQLFAREDWWGSGLATALHANAVEASARRGHAALRLHTPADHARGRRFYEREGWTYFSAFDDEAFGMRIAEYRRPTT